MITGKQTHVFCILFEKATRNLVVSETDSSLLENKQTTID